MTTIIDRARGRGASADDLADAATRSQYTPRLRRPRQPLQDQAGEADHGDGIELQKINRLSSRTMSDEALDRQDHFAHGSCFTAGGH